MPRILKNPKDKKTGRPAKITKEVVDKLEQAWALGCTDMEACFYADVSRDALMDYQATYPEFVLRKERLKQRPILEARQTVVKAVRTDPDLALKYLERKLKSEFSLLQRYENQFLDKEGKPADFNPPAIQINIQDNSNARLTSE